MQAARTIFFATNGFFLTTFFGGTFLTTFLGAAFLGAAFFCIRGKHKQRTDLERGSEAVTDRA